MSPSFIPDKRWVEHRTKNKRQKYLTISNDLPQLNVTPNESILAALLLFCG